jgi:hypothetical protein
MSATIRAEPKKKIIKTRKALPAEDVEPERSPTPPPFATEMTKFFEENPDDFDEDALKEQVKKALSQTKTKKPKVETKGKTKAELKGYSSTKEAEALGFFSAGDTCDGCGKVFNRKFYKAYHFISKDNQTCDGKVKRSNGKAVRPVVVKAKDWVASWSETAIEFGMLEEPLAFTSKDINRFMCLGEDCPGLQEALQHKPFRKKFAQYANDTKVKTCKRFEIQGEHLADVCEEFVSLWDISKEMDVWGPLTDDSDVAEFVAQYY